MPPVSAQETVYNEATPYPAGSSSSESQGILLWNQQSPSAHFYVLFVVAPGIFVLASMLPSRYDSRPFLKRSLAVLVCIVFVSGSMLGPIGLTFSPIQHAFAYPPEGMGDLDGSANSANNNNNNSSSSSSSWPVLDSITGEYQQHPDLQDSVLYGADFDALADSLYDTSYNASYDNNNASYDNNNASYDNNNASYDNNNASYDNNNANYDNLNNNRPLSGHEKTAVQEFLSELQQHGSSSIRVLNEQSYPAVGGHWTVDFVTEGTHDLVISAINGTSFGTGLPDDLEFVSLYGEDIGSNSNMMMIAQNFLPEQQHLVGSSNSNMMMMMMIAPEFVYDDESKITSVVFPDYSGDSTASSFEMLVHTPGKHHLKLEFGDSVAYANNYAYPSSTAPPVKINNSTANLLPLLDDSYFGTSVAGIGDLDGDGTADIAVGLTGGLTVAASTGAVHVLFMNPDGSIKRTAEINGSTANGPTDIVGSDNFGASVAGIGDLNRDGIPDIVAGATITSTQGSYRGAVYVMLMDTDGSVKSTVKIDDSTTASLVLANHDMFGASVAGIGDLNNDGTTDIVVGASNNDSGGGSGKGAIHILFMNTDGTVKSTQRIDDFGTGGSSFQPNYFGLSVANIGDLNNDGIADIAVGAPGNDNKGTVYVLFMNTDGTVKSTKKIDDSTTNGPPSLADRTFFGASVASIGDINSDGTTDIAVGASGNDSGAIYIILLNSDGTVNGTAKIDDSTTDSLVFGSDSNFGTSVANIGDLNGDGMPDIAVGAPYEGTNDGGSNTGAVHIIYLDAIAPHGTGSARETVKIDDTTADGPILSDGDRFGYSVAGIGDLDGDGVEDIAVGAYQDTHGGAGTGVIHILFMNTGGTIKRSVEINSSTLNGPTLSTDDRFGISVAGIGDLNNDGIPDIVAGANYDDTGGRDKGAIHILFMNTNGSVKETVKIDDSTPNGPVLSIDDEFGASVALIGDLDDDGVSDIAAGAPTDATGGDSRGAIHILLMNSDGTVKSTIKIDDSTTDGPALADYDKFGASVAGIGDLNNDGTTDIAVGAPDNDNKGTVYVLFMNTDGTVKSTIKIDDSTPNGPVPADYSYFGTSVANIGDLDGDGVLDIVVGAPGDPTGGDRRGAVFVMLMNTNGTVKSTAKIDDSTANGPVLFDQEQFGSSVAGIGDINDDGIADIAVGINSQNPNSIYKGAIYTMFMNADGTVKSTQRIDDTTADGPILSDGDLFGASVAGIGDLDGDGIPDIVAGAYKDDHGGTDKGAIHILFMNRDGTIKRTAQISNPEFGSNNYYLSDHDGFGYSVASIGDLDGDGTTDIAVGAYQDDNNGRTTNTGAVYVLFMNPDGTAKSYSPIKNSTANGPVLSDDDNFGYSVAGIGDLDGDGIPDIVAGAPLADTNYFNDGAIFVMLMNADGSIKSTIKIDNSTNSGPVLADYSFFGSSVANIGDLNNDGIADIAVGAERDGDTASDGGAVFILFMNSDGTVSSTKRIDDTVANVPTILDYDQFGSSVAGIGDINGDGAPDIAVGVQGAAGGKTDTGAVYVLLMNTDGSVKATKVIDSSASPGGGPDDAEVSDGDQFGSSVALIGDLDDDGIPDIVAGADLDDTDGADKGAIYVMYMQKEIVVNAVSSDNADGTYGTLGEIDISVHFSAPVIVTGTPYIYLNVDSVLFGSGVAAGYASGNNTDTLHFTYLIQPGEQTSKLEYSGTNALLLNDNIIRDAAFPHANADQTLPPKGIVLSVNPPKTFGSLGMNSNIVIADDLGPNLHFVSFNAGTGKLTIEFDEPIYNSLSGDINLAKLFLSAPNTVNQTPLAGASIDTTGHSAEIAITLTERQRTNVIGNSTEPQLDIADSAVTDLFGNAIDASDDNTVNVTADTVKPAFESAAFDAGTGMLTIVFDERIDNTPTTDIDLTKLFLSAPNTVNQVSLDGAAVQTTGNSTEILIQLTLPQISTVLANSLTPQLDIGVGAVRDISGNAIDAATDNAVTTTNAVQPPSPGSPTAVTPDNTPPKLESAALDEETGVLAITFDEIIANEGFDLSTADYADNSFLVDNKDTDPESVTFNTNGTKMFVVGFQSAKVFEYTLDAPFDVSNPTFVRHFSVASQDTHPTGMAFNTNGTKMFVAGNINNAIYEYTLTTPFDLSTASYANSSVSVASQGTSPHDVAFNTDGTKMFVVGNQHDSIYEYTLTTPFSLDTASYANSSFSVGTQDTGPEGVAFNPDGTKMFVAGAQHDNIYEYTLTTPFDLSNVSHTGTLSVGSQDTSLRGVAFNPAGTKMFVVGAGSARVHEYALSTPVDLSKLFINESGSVNGTGMALTGARITTVGNSTSIEIKLTAPQLQSVITLATPELDILAAAVSDVSGNEILASYDNIIAVTNSVAAVPPPLAAPTGLSVAVQGTTATITWTAPAIPANSFYDINSVSYIVNVTDTAAGTTVPYTVPAGTTTTHTATNLIPGKSYEVTVKATALLSDSAVLSSQPTAAVSFAVSEPPSLDAPTNLLVNVINGTAAEITWTAPTVDDTNDFYTINDVTYQVNILDSLNAFTASSRSITATSYTATNLTPGESYNVFVSADAAVGSSYIVQSVGVSAPFDMPAAAVVVDSGGAGTPPSPDHPQVQNLEIEKTGDQKVTLTWEAPANSGNKEFLHYSVSYKCYATGDDYTKISTGFTFVSIDNLDINGLCEFNVTPIYSDASGKNSQIISTTPLKDILIAVTPDDIRLTAAMDGSDAIKVSWLPISSDVFAYDLAWNDPSEGSSQFVPFGTKHFVDGDRSTSHIIKDVKPGYTYTIALTLLYYGTDADSELVPRVIIIEYTVPDLAVAVPPPPLDAPTNLAVAVQGTEATITWTAPVIPANSFYTIDDISYTVEVYNPGIYDRISEHDGRTTGTSYTITGLTSGESYRIVVYAVVTVANHGLLESFAHVLFDMPAVLPVPVVPVVPVPPSADSTPPTFESATLDEETGVLAITFDEIIANEGFDLSTAAHTDRSFSVGTQETSPTGMAFSTDGTKMFVAGAQHDRVYEYTLSVPFDVSTLSFVDDPFSVSAQDATPADVAFNTNGTKMFVVGNAGGEIHEYTLDTPFDVSSSVFAEDSFPVSDRDASPTGMAFSTNGTKMFVIGAQYDRVYEYTLSVPFDVSSSVFADVSFPVSDQDTTPADVAFNTDGTKMFVVGNAGDAIHEYALSAPFDISAPTHADTFSVSLQDANPTGVAFNPAGTKMFVVGATGGDIHEYALASSLDLSKLFISESGNTNDISLTGASIETVGNSDSIEIELTASQRESVIALTTPQLDILKGAVSDVSGNQIDASPDNHITITGTGRSSGGGSSSSSSTESTPPSFPTTSFDGKTNTIFIGTVGISPEPSRLDYTLDNPVLVQTGQSIPISLTMHDNMSWESISHVELCLNKQISNNQICDSDTKLVWDKKYNDGNNNDNNSNSLKIIDPNGLIENASVSIAKVDVRVATWDYSVTFGKAMDTSDIQIYAWDDRRNALTFTIHNALTVTAQNDAQGSSSSSDTASSSSGGSSSSSSGGSSSSSSGGSSSSSSSSSSDDTITSSCDAGKLLLDTGLCMDPEPGTFACLSEQVMNHDGTCLDASKTAIAQDDKVIKLLPPSSDTQSTDAIKKQNEMVKRWAGYSEFSATDAELIKSLGITNDLPPDVSLPKWIKKHLGEMVYKNQISVEQLKTVLSYMVGVLK